MSQQPLPSTQSGPDSGGEITTACASNGDRRDDFGHGGGKQRRHRLRHRDADRVHQRGRNNRILVQCDVEPHDRGLRGAQFRCRRGLSDNSRSSEDSDRRTGPASCCLADADRCHRHILVEDVGELELVGQVDLPSVGHRHGSRDDVGQHGSTPADRSAGRAGAAVDGVAASRRRGAARRRIRRRAGRCDHCENGERRAERTVRRFTGLLWIGLAPRLGFGRRVSGLRSVDRSVGIDILFGAEHEEEHHPADHRDEYPADQSVDQHRRDRSRQRHSARNQAGHQHRLDDKQPAGHQRNRTHRPCRREATVKPASDGLPPAA